MSKFKGKKTNNAKINAKVAIRKNVFNSFEVRNVLDIFCGAGEMYTSIWCQADNYLGIDKKKFSDPRVTIVGDAHNEIKHIDVNQYNIYDIDAYGDPYKILGYLSNKINSRKVAFIITDGLEIDMRMGNIHKSMINILNLKNNKINSIHLMHDFYIKKIIDAICEKLNSKASMIQYAKGNKGSGMRYYSFISTPNDAG